MTRLHLSALGGRFVAALGALAFASPAASQSGPPPAPPGQATYVKWCAGCHGEDGAGEGEAAPYMLPRPRDFTRAVFQIRTTPSGSVPSDADLLKVIDQGMPGTAMPAWKPKLSDRERRELVAYLKTFSRFFQGAPPEPLQIGKPPSGGGGAEAIADGRETFRKLECFKCHGQAGRGDGPSAPSLKDDWDFPIRAADLTENWTFNGGGSVDQIYARLRTGLDGTPMPSFSDVIESNVITDQQLWRVAQYVHSLSPARPPQVRDVIRARRVARLPQAPGDSAWASAEAFYIPLVGQIIQRPRWFVASVDGLWVRALHDGGRLALRLSWSDPSQSPDSSWQEWLDRVGGTVARDDTTALEHGPDRLTVQFPLDPREEAERPYFLGGSPRHPVYLWRWGSHPDTLEEGPGTGLGEFRPAAGPARVTHTARFDQGEWRLQLTRDLVPRDTSRAPAPEFPPGRVIPIAFAAADGSNGEDAVRGAVSAWYAIYLDVPTPGRVYVQPVVTAALTAGLGLILVLRAQRRARGAGGADTEAS